MGIVFEPPASGATFDWALAYAAARMPVFPANAKKEPIGKLCPNGVKDATTDETVIRSWWARWPHADAAWAVPAAIVVVDLDCRRGDNGVRDFAGREGAHPDDVDTPQASTPTGGRHLVYAANGAVYRNNVRINGWAIDLRTAGGYIVLPGAANGRAWLKPLSTPLKPVPQWVRPADARQGVTEPMPRAAAQSGSLDARLRAIIGRIERAVEGERNCIVFWAACRFAELARDGLVDERWAAEVLTLAGRRAGLPASETRRTIASGLKTAGTP